MVTRNFINLVTAILQSSSTIYATLPIFGVNGITYFLTNNFAFPGSRTESFTTNANAAGISFGTGTTPAKEADKNLEATITSGLTVTLTSKTISVELGAPCLKYSFTVTNTSSDAIMISEIGYKQVLRCGSWPTYTGSFDVVCLIDRTVLDSPITIEAGDAGVVEYSLKSVPSSKYVNNVKIVDWTYGSDEDVAAMIDAARLGTINLQTDGGWAVGDVRPINISAFTGGGNVSHAAQTIDIVISQFGDYNSCGSLFQFDFVESLATVQRMNSDHTNVGGYGSSEMKTTTLPALVEALPSWLSERLLTFDVLTSAGNRSSTIETVSGNKLALRSAVEIFGVAACTTAYSFEGEGSQIDYYKLGTPITKRRGRAGGDDAWWERSPVAALTTSFCNVSYRGGIVNYGTDAMAGLGISPFGCI